MIMLSSWGNMLYSRDMGAKLREQIVNNLNTNDNIELNFNDVNMITHSFADEAFGKLLFFMGIQDLRKKLKFTNVNDEVQCIIKFAIKNRIDKVDNPPLVTAN